MSQFEKPQNCGTCRHLNAGIIVGERCYFCTRIGCTALEQGAINPELYDDVVFCMWESKS